MPRPATTLSLSPGCAYELRKSGLGKAFAHIRGKRVGLHREWMIRAFAIALAIATQRLIEDVPSSVELRWRPGDHQAAAAVSV
jgi:hypothetical protein